jgi:hypothetical protein
LIAINFKFLSRFLAQPAAKAAPQSGFFGGTPVAVPRGRLTPLYLQHPKRDSIHTPSAKPRLETKMTHIPHPDSLVFEDLTSVDSSSVTLIENFQSGETIEIDYEKFGETPVVSLLRIDDQQETHILLDGILVARIMDPKAALTMDAITLIAV